MKKRKWIPATPKDWGWAIMLPKKGPFPSPGWIKQQAANNTAPMMALISGELAYGNVSGPLGACAMAGNISAVWLSIEESGKDDSATLSVTADVMINGTTWLAPMTALAPPNCTLTVCHQAASPRRPLALTPRAMT